MSSATSRAATANAGSSRKGSAARPPPGAIRAPRAAPVVAAGAQSRNASRSAASSADRLVIELLDARPAVSVHRRPSAKLPPQPGLREPPVPVHGFGRDAERRGGFLYAQSAKEAQLDDPALALVDLRERLQRQVERDEIGRALDRDVMRIVERRRRARRYHASGSASSRAISTRMRRISRADVAKKCDRSCHSTGAPPTSRR